MNANWKTGLWVAAAVILTLGVASTVFKQSASHAVPATDRPATAAQTMPNYSVVLTEGHNLIVTDNRTDTLYFYTIDKDKEIGSQLHLRGSMDLKLVGKDEIMPRHHKKHK